LASSLTGSGEGSSSPRSCSWPTGSNAILHITGAIVDRAYVPGLVTAIVLYLPYCAWVAAQVVRSRRVPNSLVAAAAVLGGIPMAVHGYRILFLGSRLF
jgi:hypothetical protein